ncbi:succinate dehydrogenase assembly factor 2 [Aquibium sp. A9E412]|uniref:FAD assembly factor SdhE n=1 Tax=Aquibium sp. A9E412 TaxID=2976767 RepID=UPI0025AF69A1|nr:succinate dehydrogenase assembly factor 2 [Aquibium sp. A9E412]MDN2566349.1 succinate dehydrogenase assembly factor 2 [Aquibium sp. A9E412]
MTGTTRSSADLDPRRRRALFRSWHRGTREMDLILGRFADAWIDRLTASELAAYEALLDVPDGELMAWLTGRAAPPAAHDTPVLERIRSGGALPRA